MNPAESIRQRIGATIFNRIAGDEGPQRRDRIHLTEGPRRYAPDSAIYRVHGDASMFVGGLRALLLQSLHPLAMAAVAAHSGYRGDPWGRLQRTSTFLAETTFSTIEDADRAIEVVRAVHERVRGTAPDGRPYAASDPAPDPLGAHRRDRQLPASPRSLWCAAVSTRRDAMPTSPRLRRWLVPSAPSTCLRPSPSSTRSWRPTGPSSGHTGGARGGSIHPRAPTGVARAARARTR